MSELRDAFHPSSQHFISESVLRPWYSSTLQRLRVGESNGCNAFCIVLMIFDHQSRLRMLKSVHLPGVAVQLYVLRIQSPSRNTSPWSVVLPNTICDAPSRSRLPFSQRSAIWWRWRLVRLSLSSFLPVLLNMLFWPLEPMMVFLGQAGLNFFHVSINP